MTAQAYPPTEPEALAADTFLSGAEVRWLTGRAQKQKQAQILRRQGIPFFLNAAGIPVVTRAAIEGGRRSAADVAKPWRPAVLGA